MAQPIFGPPTPFWVRLTLLVDVVGIAIGAAVTFDNGSDVGTVWGKRVIGVLMMVPSVLVAVRMGKRPRIWLYGVAASVALTVGTVMLFLPAAVAMGAAYAQGRGMGITPYVWTWGLIQVCVIVWVIRAVRRTNQPGAARQAWAGFGATIAWPTIYVSIARSVEASVGLASFARVRAGEQQLRAAVVATARCAFQYADAHPGAGYPQSLDAMGPGGTKCLDKSITRRAAQYSLRYQAVASDENGPATFIVRGHMIRVPGTTAETLSVVTDTSAAIRRNAFFYADTTARIAGDKLPDWLNKVRDCADFLSERLGRPPSMAELVASAKENLTTESDGCTPYEARTAVKDSIMSADLGYRMTYQVDAAGYRLDARPTTFGVTALRNYLLDPGGVLHITREDRAATESDPILAPCLPYDVGDCMPTPSARPPIAAFLHDSVVRADQRYVLRVRVAGNPARIPDDRITWLFDCDVRAPADTTRPEAQTFMSSSRRPADQSCYPLAERTPPIGETLVVRLWLKGPKGAIVRMQDTVRIVTR